ncbi:MAG: hypothetical protein V1916_00925 [Patescibacteria group bacterium]
MQEAPLAVEPTVDDRGLEEAIDRYLDEQLISLNTVRAYVAVYWWQSVRGTPVTLPSLVRILVNAQVTTFEARRTLTRIENLRNIRVRGEGDHRTFTLTNGPPLRAG